MKAWKLLAVSASVLMQGCASQALNFTPADPEMMQEWQVEGSMSIEGKDAEHATFFTWTQVGDQYVLELKPESPTGSVSATIKGSQGSNAVTVMANDAHSEKTAAMEKRVSQLLPLEYFGFWLRGMQATEEAQVTESSVRTIEALEEDGWQVQYGSYMHLGSYQMPEEIRIRGKELDIEMKVVRGEPGYLSHCCFNDSPKGLSANTSINVATSQGPATIADKTVDGAAVVEQLVPSTGMAPLPRWVNDQEFCEQLKKIHGGVPDPKIGLYGPDSMMWKIARPVVSGSWGAGRALLLQTAHPWVTAGIDEHSIVREDPMLRARRTFVNIFTMVYGSMPQVMASANLVHKSHNSIKGEIPYEAGAFKKHSEYRANEISAMIWVHATLWDTLVMMYEEMEAPLTAEEKERFYEETKLFAMLFGIPRDALPPDWNSFMAYNRAMWNSSQLTVTDATINLKNDLFTARSLWLVVPLWAQEIITAHNMPPRLREAYGMDYGWWEKMNYSLMKSGAKVTEWLLPKSLEYNPVYHEAQARLRGERVGYLQRKAIAVAMEKERLVN